MPPILLWHPLNTVTGATLLTQVFGDHCSPISDTTVLTAQVCGCSLGSHVTTQGAYAITCAIVATLVGTLPVGFGAYPDWAGLLLGSTLTVALVFLLGAPVRGVQQDLVTRGLRGTAAVFQRLRKGLHRHESVRGGGDSTTGLLSQGGKTAMYGESSA